MEDSPVANLAPGDPLNVALGAYQCLFNDVHAALLGFIDEPLRAALASGYEGFLEVRVTRAGGRLTVQQHLRRAHEAPSFGEWWRVPVGPDILRELFARTAPAEAAPRPPVDVDASEVTAPGDAAAHGATGQGTE